MLSAAEVLVAVSGVVVGMVFGRRWIEHGRRATTAMLLARAKQLYVATVSVIALVGLLVALPWMDTSVVTASPRMAAGTDLYAFDGVARTLIAIVTLEAGPWQFSILGLFIALLVATPGLLWMLERGWWLPAIGIELGALRRRPWVGRRCAAVAVGARVPDPDLAGALRVGGQRPRRR